MRVAVTTDDKFNTSYPLDRAKGFMIYDIENGNIINRFYRVANFSKSRKDSNLNILESGKNYSFQEVLKDCTTVITHCLGIVNRDIFKNYNIEIFQTTELNVDNALEQYIHSNIRVVA